MLILSIAALRWDLGLLEPDLGVAVGLLELALGTPEGLGSCPEPMPLMCLGLGGDQTVSRLLSFLDGGGDQLIARRGAPGESEPFILLVSAPPTFTRILQISLSNAAAASSKALKPETIIHRK